MCGAVFHKSVDRINAQQFIKYADKLDFLCSRHVNASSAELRFKFCFKYESFLLFVILLVLYANQI